MQYRGVQCVVSRTPNLRQVGETLCSTESQLSPELVAVPPQAIAATISFAIIQQHEVNINEAIVQSAADANR